MARAVMWFRRDLRLADNPALEAAAAEGAVVPLFVVDPVFFSLAGSPRRQYLLDTLRALDTGIGGAMVVRRGDPAEVVPAVAAEVGAATVHCAEDFGPYGRRRDAAVASALARDGRHLRCDGSPYAVRPGRVLTRTGTPFRVFTPFGRAWEAAGWEAPGGPPEVEWLGAPHVRDDGLPLEAPVPAELPTAGEHAAHRRLDAFVANGLDAYASRRDLPGEDGTSRLSAHLRFGVLHPRQMLVRLGSSRDHAVFRSELAWREFYADVLAQQPDTAWRNLQPAMDAMPVDTDAAARRRFEAWREGRTGYPIVDAGMRQLLGTGWMHNRVRMIVASFLVKDLHLPWQWGARHFLRHLVDGDLASNNHGWQWAAGTGTDAAPYFRVFNPVSQGERFDPGGRYVRRWVPELAGVPDKVVHAPWTSSKGLPLGYPGPMVDHRAEREEALRRYALVTKGR